MLLVMPATNISERSFSYVVCQVLNIKDSAVLIVLHVHKEYTDELKSTLCCKMNLLVSMNVVNKYLDHFED